MSEFSPRPRSASRVEMTEIILPQHANAMGTAFGGQILAWMDIAAAVSAARHAGRTSVTACIDQVRFGKPIFMGDTVTLIANVQWVGSSSMEVAVIVYKERPGIPREACVSATLVFVSLDDDRHPTRVPGLVLDSDDARRRFEEGAERAERRRAARKQGS